MTANDICERAKALAASKTLYVKGGNGQALNQNNKFKFTGTNPYNAKRTNIIFAASEDTRAYDEFGMFAEISGYKCRVVGEIMYLCHDISKNFSTIEPGEVVFMPERIGIYVGDGKVVTCSPNGIGYTIVDGWASHGKIDEVVYSIDVVESVEEEEEVEDAEPEESEVELRPSGTGSGDRVQSLPSQAKSYDRGHGRRRS